MYYISFCLNRWIYEGINRDIFINKLRDVCIMYKIKFLSYKSIFF